jgi:hypothetical protein
MTFTCRLCGIILRLWTHDDREDRAALEALGWNSQGTRCKRCREQVQ